MKRMLSVLLIAGTLLFSGCFRGKAPSATPAPIETPSAARPSPTPSGEPRASEHPSPSTTPEVSPGASGVTFDYAVHVGEVSFYTSSTWDYEEAEGIHYYEIAEEVIIMVYHQDLMEYGVDLSRFSEPEINLLFQEMLNGILAEVSSAEQTEEAERFIIDDRDGLTYQFSFQEYGVRGWTIGCMVFTDSGAYLFQCLGTYSQRDMMEVVYREFWAHVTFQKEVKSM